MLGLAFLAQLTNDLHFHDRCDIIGKEVQRQQQVHTNQKGILSELMVAGIREDRLRAALF